MTPEEFHDRIILWWGRKKGAPEAFSTRTGFSLKMIRRGCDVDGPGPSNRLIKALEALPPVDHRPAKVRDELLEHLSLSDGKVDRLTIHLEISGAAPSTKKEARGPRWKEARRFIRESVSEATGVKTHFRGRVTLHLRMARVGDMDNRIQGVFALLDGFRGTRPCALYDDCQIDRLTVEFDDISPAERFVKVESVFEVESGE